MLDGLVDGTKDTAAAVHAACPVTAEPELLLGAQSVTLPLQGTSGSGVPASSWWLAGNTPGGANIAAAWSLASGRGIGVGVVDSGVNRYHLDLTGNEATLPASLAGLSAASDAPLDDPHGTRVAGLIAGRIDNDIAGMGVADGAAVIATRISFDARVDAAHLASVLSGQAAYDVSNSSWGFTQAFSDNFRSPTLFPIAAAIAEVATGGRDGLGTVMVFAGGNGRLTMGGVNVGDDSNFHNLTNSRHTIAVGATDATGKATLFSSPGTNLLLSAPGIGLLTADGLEVGATGQAIVAGTSFAAPLVSGTAALMLEVNPTLGYRDVQKILALTARAALPVDSIGPGGGGAQANAAQMLNGGGMVFDRDIGFGILDAAAAVRLAAAWDKQSTAANEVRIEVAAGPVTTADGLRHDLLVEVAAPDAGLALTAVELVLSVSGAPLRNMSITLESPAGTQARIAPNLQQLGSKTSLAFSFASLATWGEEIAGTWRITLALPAAAPALVVHEARLAFHGDAEGGDGHDGGVHYFNRGFAAQAAANPARKVIVHQGETPGTLMFAALDTPVAVDLQAATGRLDGVGFTLQGSFSAIRGGAGRDTLQGGQQADTLLGGAGGDRIGGGDGDDDLRGDGGADTLHGGNGNDVLRGGTTGDLIFGGSHADTIYGHSGNDTLHGDSGADVIYGMTNRDLIFGGSGTDLLYGGDSADTIDGGTGEDTIYGGAASDVIDGGSGDDWVYGGTGDDLVNGLSGKDRLYGGAGNDTIFGGSASDTIYGGSGDDILDAGTGADRVFGGAGADSFVFSTRPSATNYNRLPDFDPTEDHLLLSRAVFAPEGRDLQFETGSAAQTGDATLLWHAATGVLWWDADGTGPAEPVRVAILSPHLTITADDITLI